MRDLIHFEIRIFMLKKKIYDYSKKQKKKIIRFIHIHTKS